MGIMDTFRKLENNPLYFREFYYHNRGKKEKPKSVGTTIFIVVAYIIYGLGLYLLFKINEVSFDNDYSFILNVLIFIMSLMGMSLIYKLIFIGSSLIVEEKERKIYPMLIASAMKSDDIVDGKFWTIFYPISREFAFYYCFLVLTTLLTLGAYIPAACLFYFAITIIIIIRAAAYMSLWASAKASRLIDARKLAQGHFIMNAVVAFLFCYMGYVFISIDLFQILGMKTVSNFINYNSSVIFIIYATIIAGYFGLIGYAYKELVTSLIFKVPDI